VAGAHRGPYYLLAGFRLIRKPGVRRFVILPLAINIVIAGLLWWMAWGQIEGWLVLAVEWLPGWLEWLRFLLWPLAWIVSLLAFCFLLTWLANLVGAPFNGFLAAAVEQELTGLRPDSGLGMGAEILQGFAGELRKLWFFGLRAAMLAALSFLLFLIPGLNALIPVLWMLFGAYMLAFEYLDYPASNHALKFADKRAWLSRHRWSSLGFGGTVTLATAVPLANLLVMPAAVAGATALWVDLERNRSSKTEAGA
jgi:CysZ protein